MSSIRNPRRTKIEKLGTTNHHIFFSPTQNSQHIKMATIATTLSCSRRFAVVSLRITDPSTSAGLSQQRRYLGTKRRRGPRYETPKKITKDSNSKSKGPRPAKNWMDKLKQQQQQKPEQNVQTIVPPALLAPTASPYVFIAKPALMEDGEMTMDPSVLFSDGAIIPPVLAKNEFVYMPPKELNFEYPPPKYSVPEVAFLGRSNVGKSSLVNAIMQKNLCITSKAPGRTQLPYYYGLFSRNNTVTERVPANALGYIIDLPGYGFGATRQRDVVDDWQMRTQDLLLDRRDAGVLKRLFLLLDTRRDEWTKLDRTVMEWLEDASIPYSVVLTKADRTPLPLVVKQVNAFCLRFASQQALLTTSDESDDASVMVAQSPVIHVTSSKQNWGLPELMLSVEAEFVGEEE
jgi:ribosome biogenesis GTP-binding protein YsxC/EngB